MFKRLLPYALVAVLVMVAIAACGDGGGGGYMVALALGTPATQPGRSAALPR